LMVRDEGDKALLGSSRKVSNVLTHSLIIIRRTDE
jgi:hypothetical protein